MIIPEKKKGKGQVLKGSDSILNYCVKPNNIQFVINNLPLLIIGFFSLLFTGYEEKYVSLSCICLSSLILLLLVGRWWKMKATSWVITPEQIVYTRGVLVKHKDFLELYRIIDFKETQSFLQQFWGLKNIVITSGDKSHPTLVIFGVKEKMDITNIIRERVELNKQIKHVYEISNR